VCLCLRDPVHWTHRSQYILILFMEETILKFPAYVSKFNLVLPKMAQKGKNLGKILPYSKKKVLPKMELKKRQTFGQNITL
jgi:hypothetical protein